ncbi:chitin deacetylase, partial [Irineochytrium annulatum]
WPAPDKAPPTNAIWNARYLTSIPHEPVASAPQSSPNWASDHTSCTDASQWAITFDDGPGGNTPALLDFLDSVHVKATFFIVGSRVAESATARETLLRAYNSGHQIGCHTWSHTAISTQTNEEIVAEVMWTNDIIEEVTGQRPRYFRPPYGDIDARSRAVLKAMGLEVVVWNKDTSDWELSSYPKKVRGGITPNVVENKVASWIKSPPKNQGIVSLEHDLWQYSASTGLKVVQVS